MADAEPQDIQAAEPHAEEDTEIKRASRLAQRRKWLIRLAVVVAAVALIYALWYFLIGRNHVSTDNAYVNAEVAQVTPLISVYGSVARGFSPPTSEELLPSTGVITGDLEAEEGWNTEAGRAAMYSAAGCISTSTYFISVFTTL